MPEVPNVRTKELPGRGLCSLSGFSSSHVIYLMSYSMGMLFLDRL